MIEFVKGDLLCSPAEALVNTVNTVGVMGKGLALQFKKAFPDNHAAYVRACKLGDVVAGRMFVMDRGFLLAPRYIINFPTKEHWRQASKLEHVRLGLQDLVLVVRDLGVSSVAVPALGVGNGGLDWSLVQPLIVEAFEALPEVRVFVFEPQNSVAHDLVAPNRSLGFNPRRAALLKLFSEYTKSGDSMGRLEAQKLAYFLQRAGLDLRLSFAKEQYGPYAENLNPLLQRFEGVFLQGYGDRKGASAMQVLPGVAQQAAFFLEGHDGLNAAVARAVAWIEGFESPYGLELLATVDWVHRHEAAPDAAAVWNAVQSWNARKKKLFAKDHVLDAWQRVQQFAHITA